jgi:hypothetical protein
MGRKNATIKAQLLTTHFGAKYTPANNFLTELNLLHSTKINSVGGEIKLNDSNTLVETGVSDFQGLKIPASENGFIDAVAFRYGKTLIADAVTNPAIVSMSAKRSDFPVWLLNSELVLKKNGTEQFRMRVGELVFEAEPQKVRSEWVKELERALKVEGGQDLEITLASAKGAALSTTHHEFVGINLYGVKFSDRKTA